MAENEREEKNILPSNYGCQILLENTTVDKAKDASFPTDAWLIWYKVNEKMCLDLTRGSKIRIFDMYHDKYGSGAIQKIDFGYGRINPKLWGSKQSDKKKKR